MKVLAALTDTLDQDLFRPGAVGADALLPRRLRGGLEERERTVKVNRPALQVP